MGEEITEKLTSPLGSKESAQIGVVSDADMLRHNMLYQTAPTRQRRVFQQQPAT
jgi:hypothetical protein